MAGKGAGPILVNATQVRAGLAEVVRKGARVWASEPVRVLGYDESCLLL